MIITTTVQSLKKIRASLQNCSIGFVPTMGALHKGHLALIEKSNFENDYTFVSIFVNPTQFNNPQDFLKYPSTTQQDIHLLEQQGCYLTFLPSTQEIYGDDLTIKTPYPIGALENILEGAFRPNHYQGVCQIVEKLLRVVKPDRLYLGLKDYQQCLVIQSLIKFLNLPIILKSVDTYRSPNGLALSSRNQRLSTENQEKATAIYKNLQWIKQGIFSILLKDLLKTATTNLIENGFESVDYIAICKTKDLEPIITQEALYQQKEVVVLIAATIQEVRLIDNIIISIAQQ